MASQSRITVLASTISIHTKAVDDYLSLNGLSAPSFSVETPPMIVLPEDVAKSREKILEATEELQALIAGPLPQLISLSSPRVNIFLSLHSIYRYKLAQRLGLDEKITFGELAERCGLSESDCRRFLRLAIANRIFNEPQKGFVAHNAMSKLFVQLPLVQQWIGLVCEDMWFSTPRVLDAIDKWPGSEEPEHTGFSLASGVVAPFFETLGKTPERAQRFADGMHFLQAAETFNLSHLFDNFEIRSDSRPYVMVDIGGSSGSVCIEALRRYDFLHCIVEDLPEIVTNAQVPEGLKNRLSFRGYNFFTEQPVKGADVYFFRSILHDWPEKYGIQILRNLIPALKHGARIIFNEICLPEPGELPLYEEQFLRGYDLSMKQIFNSKERDADEWAELLRNSDPRFKITSIKRPVGSMLAIIEATWEGEQVY